MSPPKVVLLGMMTKMPVAGVAWQNLHYLLGFERLGCEAYYVETHARTPSMLMNSEEDDSSALAAEYLSALMRRFGMADRWAFRALHDDGRCFGMSETALERLYGSADLLINLHGGTQPLPELAATGRLVYLETDPVQLQLELQHGLQETVDFLEPHSAFFTFAENWDDPDCRLPRSDRFGFLPTRQPVLLDLWPDRSPQPADVFTTIGNWRQDWREVTFEGKRYSWSKHQQFLDYLDLPERSGGAFELALSSCEDSEREMLRKRGWRVRDGVEISQGIDRYRDYIGASRGEFTVAKEQNVRLRTGWFSDRSATYLASGRPVITQETGFSNVFPTGDGLFGFDSFEEAEAAVEEVDRDYTRHASAAREIAREYFSHEVVLGRLLDDLEVHPRGGRRPPAAEAFPRLDADGAGLAAADGAAAGDGRGGARDPARAPRGAGPHRQAERQHRRRHPRQPRLHPALPAQRARQRRGRELRADRRRQRLQRRHRRLPGAAGRARRPRPGATERRQHRVSPPPATRGSTWRAATTSSCSTTTRWCRRDGSTACAGTWPSPGSASSGR